MHSTPVLQRPDGRRRPRSALTLDDLQVARYALLDRKGWTGTARAVEAARAARGDVIQTSPRALRRAFERHGIQVDVPPPPRPHRPRKPDLTEAECKLAIAAASKRGPKGAPNWKAAAAAVNEGRLERDCVSARWVELRLHDRLEDP